MKALEYRNCFLVFYYYFRVVYVEFVALHFNASISLKFELCFLNAYRAGGEKICKMLAAVIQGLTFAKQVA